MGKDTGMENGHQIFRKTLERRHFHLHWWISMDYLRE